MLGYAIIWGGLGQLAPRIGWRPLFLILEVCCLSMPLFGIWVSGRLRRWV